MANPGIFRKFVDKADPEFVLNYSNRFAVVRWKSHTVDGGYEIFLTIVACKSSDLVNDQYTTFNLFAQALYYDPKRIQPEILLEGIRDFEIQTTDISRDKNYVWMDMAIYDDELEDLDKFTKEIAVLFKIHIDAIRVHENKELLWDLEEGLI